MSFSLLCWISRDAVAPLEIGAPSPWPAATPYPLRGSAPAALICLPLPELTVFWRISPEANEASVSGSLPRPRE